MIKAVQMNFWEYIFEAGNYFFRVQQSDWQVFNDDLRYEETDTDGLNGFILKLGTQSDEYTKEVQSRLSVFLTVAIQILASFFRKTSQDFQNTFNGVKESHKRIPQKNYSQNLSAQAMINHRVRNRLLEKLNEDAELWTPSSYNSKTSGRKNQTRKHRNVFKDKYHYYKVGAQSSVHHKEVYRGSLFQ